METILRMSDLFDDNDDCSPVDAFGIAALGQGKIREKPPSARRAAFGPTSIIAPHMSPAEAVEKGFITEVQLNSYTCYAALRDPFARAVSAFCHATAGQPLMNDMTFKDTVLKGKDLGLLQKPQVEYHFYNGQKVCTPINFQDFQAAVNAMIEVAGQHSNAGPYLTFPVMPNFNRTRGKEAGHNRSNFVDAHPDTKARLTSDLAEDIALYESVYGPLS